KLFDFGLAHVASARGDSAKGRRSHGCVLVVRKLKKRGESFFIVEKTQSSRRAFANESVLVVFSAKRFLPGQGVESLSEAHESAVNLGVLRGNLERIDVGLKKPGHSLGFGFGRHGA